MSSRTTGALDTYETAARDRRAYRFAFFACAVVFGAVLLRSAWFADDAYIAFRSSLNLATGHGLRWNPDERVQAFTSPLWTLVVAASMLFSREPYFVVMPLHLVCTVATLGIVFRLAGRPAVALASAAALLLSKAFVDYSSSGLENSLSHLIVASFVAATMAPSEPVKRLRRVALIAGIAMVDRLDLALLVGPTLAYVTLTAWRSGGTTSRRRRLWMSLFVGLAPIVAWEAFAIVYFGFALSNTYYAKASSGLGMHQLFLRGAFYLYNSLLIDPVTLCAITLGCGFALRSGTTRASTIAAGVALYIAYVVSVGGDFMTGRFLSAPLVGAVCVFAGLLRSDTESLRLVATGWVTAVVIAGYVGRFPSLTTEYQSLAERNDPSGISDSQREAWPSTGLSGLHLFRPLPYTAWVYPGQDVHNHPEKVPVLGGVGIPGFYAGTVGHIVDLHALTDALLAHLPIPDASHETRVRTGHFIRRIPEGYPETFASGGENRIKAPELHRYFDVLRLITSGPILSRARLRAIVSMHLGAYDGLIRAYLREYDRKVIKVSDLTHGADDISNVYYSYWAPCAANGVAFTDTGAEVQLDQPVSSAILHLSAGEYQMTLLLGREAVATSRGSEGAVRVTADHPFDRIYIDVPPNRDARWTLSGIDDLH